MFYFTKPNNVLETIKLVGGILGIIAFVWKLLDAAVSYLYMDLSVEDKNGECVIAKMSVENKGFFPKYIRYAFLLIGPESENPVETAQNISEYFDINCKIKHARHIKRLKINDPHYTDTGRVIIPLPYFYLEQSNIGDEKLKYVIPIKTDTFSKSVSYSVRFFILRGLRIVRSTQDILILI